MKLTFTTKLAEEPLVIDDVQYRLVELDGHERDQYNKLVQGRTVFDEKGVPISVNMEGLSHDLVSASIRDEKGERPFTALAIGRWPTSTIDALYDAARAINKMKGSKEEKEEVKKG